MSISSLTNNTSIGSNKATSKATVAENFDTFLSILTTQLKNQNPLDPLDTNQFTQQLVQFSAVEQQLKSNEFLQALVLANKSSSITQGVAFVGKEVTAETTMSVLKEGTASWQYDAASTADNATITVKDGAGNVVYTTDATIEGGKGRFDWDGIDSTGQQMKDGPYQISIDARDANGAYITVRTQMAGTVDGVDFSGDEPFLLIGGSRISMGSVLSVSTPKSST
jgi:flagellar basal-body rod modification protein FlgD